MKIKNMSQTKMSKLLLSREELIKLLPNIISTLISDNREGPGRGVEMLICTQPTRREIKSVIGFYNFLYYCVKKKARQKK